jgi:TonB family protein
MERRLYLLGWMFASMSVVRCEVLSSQEPALFRNQPAARFEEAAGVFHYIVPCTEGNTDANATGERSALCWPVTASHVQRVDGKLVQSEAVQGTVRISASEVAFLPDEPKGESQAKPYARSETAFSHKAGAGEARFGNKDEIYVFTFSNACFGCTAGAVPQDPSKAAQVDQEYELFHQALKDFKQVQERIVALSEQSRALVVAAGEPNVTDTKNQKPIKIIKVDPSPTGVGISGTSGAPVVAAQPHPNGIIRVSPGVLAGSILERTPPEYPPIARSAHLSGSVVLRAIISKQGTIENLQVLNTTNSLFNDAALDAVKHWRYKPYRLNGEPVEVDTTITVNFNMGGDLRGPMPHLPMN